MERYEILFYACIICCVLYAFGPLGEAAEKVSCNVPELVEGNAEYNQLVCKGVRDIDKKQYEEAIAAFEVAMAKPLFEFPNFQLYPRLALAYFRAGNAEKARENLLKANVALSVLIGTLRCEETKRGFRLVKSDGSVVRRPYKAEISRRMCGAAYDYVYEQRSLESVARDGKLIEVYLRIKKEIALTSKKAPLHSERH